MIVGFHLDYMEYIDDKINDRIFGSIGPERDDESEPSKNKGKPVRKSGTQSHGSKAPGRKDAG